MESLYLLIPVVLVAIVAAIRLLWWAINSGQYDDLDKEGRRILFDAPEKPGHQRPSTPDESATHEQSLSNSPKKSDP